MSRFKIPNPNPEEDVKVIKGVVYTNHQWDRVLGHITKKENDRRQAEMQAKQREDRLQLSKQMAATWDNTLVNLRRKRFALRQEKIDNAIKARHERYLYFKSEDERRKELVRERAREIFFEMRDSTKVLRSAEKLAECLRERQKQTEFNKKVKELEKEEEMKEARKIWADTDKWKQEQEEMKGEHSKVREERKKAALDELEKYRKEQLEKITAQKEQEKEYLEEMKKEMEQIEEFEKQEKQRFKMEYLKEVMENREMTEKKRLAAIEEEKEEDLAIQIINEGKTKLAQMRREKEREMFEETIKKRERVASLVAAEARNREELEEAILKRASIEKDRIYQREEQKKKDHAEKIRLERIQAHEEYLKETARKKEAERELMKWAVLQRFKNSETTTGVYKKFNDVRYQRYLECRNANAVLIKEHNAKLAKEKQADLDAVRRAAAIWALHDKEFLDVAMKVRDDCVAAGRPSHPLDVAIADFKKRNGLLKECRGVGFIEVMPIVPGYKEMAEKLKKMDLNKTKDVVTKSISESEVKKS